MDWDRLINSATLVRENAHCPYSGYSVGAALVDEKGDLYVGCNVENVSYGASICAERSAICKMVSEGGKKVERMVVSTSDGGTPCGICLQVLLEFRSTDRETEIGVFGAGELKMFKLSELLPLGFASFRN